MTEDKSTEQPDPHRPAQAAERSGGIDIHDGSVHVGGDMVGRDKVTTTFTAGLSSAEIEQLFAPLMQAVRALPVEQHDQAIQKVEALKAEVSKGKGTDDTIVAKLVDGIVKLVPNAVSTLVGMFASPILAGIAGPVTAFVLNNIQGK